LFQAITKKEVDKANYPFCTIDPNVGVVAVPDERVDKLAELEKSQKKIFTAIEFVDIAGLVKGASKGEGLGNKFLANIRETDAVVYILRIFQDKEIINTHDSIDPLRDKEILETELILKDLETVNKRLESVARDAKAGKKEAVKEVEILERVKNYLNEGKILSDQLFKEEELTILKNYQLLTSKPRIFLLNGKQEEASPEILKEFAGRGLSYLIFDVAQEFEAAGLNKTERLEFGYKEESGLDGLIKKSYELLGLITFFTTGPDETRAWTVKKNAKAPKAAGAIHSDFESHFIKAEVISWKDLLDCGGSSKAREKGLLRTEGKEYEVKDGDVIEFKHG
jgi:GTP-binding protein YchF